MARAMMESISDCPAPQAQKQEKEKTKGGKKTKTGDADNTAREAMRDISSTITNSRESGDYRLLSVSNEMSPFVFMSEITRDCDVTARAVRKWQASERFPTPDGNLHGRCFWRRDTYSIWQAKVLAGDFAKSSNLNNDRSDRHSRNSNKNKVRPC